MSKHPTPVQADKSAEDALSIAKATRKPGQDKQQTKLIAQGIEKGIREYKKQQKAKLRTLDKAKKRKLKQRELEPNPTTQVEAPSASKQAIVAWGLLTLTWLGIAAFAFLNA